jgi:hypothetical protein
MELKNRCADIPAFSLDDEPTATSKVDAASAPATHPPPALFGGLLELLAVGYADLRRGHADDGSARLSRTPRHRAQGVGSRRRVHHFRSVDRPAQMAHAGAGVSGYAAR